MRISDIISVIALIASFVVPVFILVYDKHSDDILPKKDRSINPGYIDTIYVSRFNKEKDIVLDICNRNKNSMTNPGFEALSDSTLEKIVNKAVREAVTNHSVLYVLNEKKQVTDSIPVSCFDCTTVGVTVPPKGFLVLSCVSGCLNNFCSYEFIQL